MLSALVSLVVAALPVAAAAAAPAAPVPEDERGAVLAAMAAELSRSTERLRLKGYEAPYFVAYQVKDVTRHELGGRYGAIFEDDQPPRAEALVDVRVGSYEFDSSGAGSRRRCSSAAEGPSWYAPKDAPLDGDVARARERALARHRRALQGGALVLSSRRSRATSTARTSRRAGAELLARGAEPARRRRRCRSRSTASAGGAWCGRRPRCSARTPTCSTPR